MSEHLFSGSPQSFLASVLGAGGMLSRYIRFHSARLGPRPTPPNALPRLWCLNPASTRGPSPRAKP